MCKEDVIPTFILVKDLGIEFSHNGDNLNVYATEHNRELLGIKHDEYPVYKDSVAYQPMYDIPSAFNEAMMDGAFKIERNNSGGNVSYIHMTPDTVLEYSKNVTHLTGVNEYGENIDVSIKDGWVSVKVDGDLVYYEADLPQDSYGNIKIGEIVSPMPEHGMKM